jgi:hypothetical protein
MLKREARQRGLCGHTNAMLIKRAFKNRVPTRTVRPLNDENGSDTAMLINRAFKNCAPARTMRPPKKRGSPKRTKTLQGLRVMCASYYFSIMFFYFGPAPHERCHFWPVCPYCSNADAQSF